MDRNWDYSSFKFINKLHEFIDRFKKYESKQTDDLEIIENLKMIINQVSENIENFQFNKSVAKIYEFVNIVNDSLLKINYLKVALSGL